MNSKEWSDKYNPFNSMKVLIWREWLEHCAKGDFLSPVTIDIDPSGRCNLDCIWCNFKDFNKECNQDIPAVHLLKIADFAKTWGIKSVHILGGGEPLMNKGVNNLLLRLNMNNIPTGLITNGILLTDKLIETIAKSCRWVGISVDAGTKEIYEKVKDISKRGYFDLVINNIKSLCNKIKKSNSGCSVCFKYLLHPFNANDIYSAAELAKSLGVNEFQVRPAGWENISNKNIASGFGFDFSDAADSIDEQINRSLLLEDDKFRVYGIRHKFSPTKQKKINFSKCWASPIVLIFGADGNCHVCGDRRGQKEFILCSHYPDIKEVIKYWNSSKHKHIINNVKLNECPRCVLGPYHEIVEKVFIKDNMCRNFP